ncbi:hypothetical protein D9758_015417 [Tetrapyrgos nigripes]|uniref:Uncharacterized protein n=1 Tax=Tetrapyrgos nigripes TaxID=182062 RepID=A0A8H5FNH7_9AGAR|nr:hypothetical protein D9758_015417 [Tetrapyrgos nigripes]
MSLELSMFSVSRRAPSLGWVDVTGDLFATYKGDTLEENGQCGRESEGYEARSIVKKAHPPKSSSVGVLRCPSRASMGRYTVHVHDALFRGLFSQGLLNVVYMYGSPMSSLVLCLGGDLRFLIFQLLWCRIERWIIVTSPGLRRQGVDMLLPVMRIEGDGTVPTFSLLLNFQARHRRRVGLVPFVFVHGAMPPWNFLSSFTGSLPGHLPLPKKSREMIRATRQAFTSADRTRPLNGNGQRAVLITDTCSRAKMSAGARCTCKA